jgi:hypothetical protein
VEKDRITNATAKGGATYILKVENEPDESDHKCNCKGEITHSLKSPMGQIMKSTATGEATYTLNGTKYRLMSEKKPAGSGHGSDCEWRYVP